LAAACAIGACSDDTRSASTGSLAAADEPAAARSSLDEFARAIPGFRIRSEVVMTGTVPTAVVGLEPTPQDRRVVVAVYAGGRWVEDASLALPAPWFSFATGEARVETGDLTGDGDPDYLLPMAAQGPTGVVVARLPSGWAVVPAQRGLGPATPYLGLDPHIVGDVVVSGYRTCEPSCADGPTLEIEWVFEDGILVSPAP
jgi:hypothetical protein